MNDWIELNEHRGAADGGPLRPYGVYHVMVEEGTEKPKGRAVIELHLRPIGWHTPEGALYRNAFVRFLRCRRIGDLPD